MKIDTYPDHDDFYSHVTVDTETAEQAIIGSGGFFFGENENGDFATPRLEPIPARTCVENLRSFFGL